MLPDTHLTDITQTTQLSVPPVFLVAALGTTLGVLANRLGRVVDRARAVETRLATEPTEMRSKSMMELELLSHRAQLVHWALTAGTGAALLVCLLIGVAFLGYLLNKEFGVTVAILLVQAMALFVVALVLFLREIYLAIDTLRFGLPPDGSQLRQEPFNSKPSANNARGRA